jgi:hypothetical protein
MGDTLYFNPRASFVIKQIFKNNQTNFHENMKMKKLIISIIYK